MKRSFVTWLLIGAALLLVGYCVGRRWWQTVLFPCVLTSAQRKMQQPRPRPLPGEIGGAKLKANEPPTQLGGHRSSAKRRRRLSTNKGVPLKRHDPEPLEIPDGPIQTRAIDANGLPIQLGFDGGWHHPDEFAARFRRRNLVREASRAVKDVDAGRFAKFWMARAMLEAAQ